MTNDNVIAQAVTAVDLVECPEYAIWLTRPAGTPVVFPEATDTTSPLKLFANNVALQSSGLEFTYDTLEPESDVFEAGIYLFEARAKYQGDNFSNEAFTLIEVEAKDPCVDTTLEFLDNDDLFPTTYTYIVGEHEEFGIDLPNIWDTARSGPAYTEADFITKANTETFCPYLVYQVLDKDQEWLAILDNSGNQMETGC